MIIIHGKCDGFKLADETVYWVQLAKNQPAIDLTLDELIKHIEQLQVVPMPHGLEFHLDDLS